MMRKLVALLGPILVTTLALAATSTQPTETLTTPNYKVAVTRHCPSTEMMCARVSANVKSKDGREYMLNRGSTYIAPVTDSKASPTTLPVKGYRFKHKKTEYTVLESGDLTITRRGKTIAKEQGSWSR